MTSDINELYSNEDGLGLGKLVSQGEVTALELVEESIRRIEAINPVLNAVIHKAYDSAREIVLGSLPDGPFKGAPFLLKGLATMWEGQPAVSLPMHWSNDGIPVGVQLVGRNNDEATLLCLVAQLESSQPWKDKRPPITT